MKTKINNSKSTKIKSLDKSIREDMSSAIKAVDVKVSRLALQTGNDLEHIVRPLRAHEELIWSLVNWLEDMGLTKEELEKRRVIVVDRWKKEELEHRKVDTKYPAALCCNCLASRNKEDFIEGACPSCKSMDIFYPAETVEEPKSN